MRTSTEIARSDPRARRTRPPEGSARVAAAPRWTFQAVAGAFAFTAATFLLLPCMVRMARSPGRTAAPTPMDVVRLPPPPTAPLPREAQSAASVPRREASAPRPVLVEPRGPSLPVAPTLDMTTPLPLGDVGDTTVGFTVSAPPVAPLLPEVKDAVFAVGELDETPQPLLRGDPVYPPNARIRQQEGSVLLEFVVGADGVTRDVRVVASSPGDLFVRSAVQAVERWRFRPGRRAGRDVAARVRQKITYRLEE